MIPQFIITCLSPSGNRLQPGPSAGADPRARLLVTQRWSEDAPVYNPHPIGVYFTGSEWRVFNEDLAAMPSGALFNVSVINVLLRDDLPSDDSGSAPLMSLREAERRHINRVLQAVAWNKKAAADIWRSAAARCTARFWSSAFRSNPPPSRRLTPPTCPVSDLDDVAVGTRRSAADL